MSGEQSQAIRDRLDTDLSIANFERDYRSAEEAATQFFQNLFVQVLNFDETTSPLGDAPWQDLPTHEWPHSARADAARLFAEAGNFRVIYVELETLTRTAERNAIQSLTRSDRTSGWAIPGSFLVVFHAPDEDIWHLVTPYEEGTSDITTGRPVLRRYTLGEGETHRTVASALADMDASTGRLAECIDEAFRVKPVTEDFYDEYKRAFDTLSTEFREDLEIEEADRYAHVTLNRLMFFYFLQKKGWIGDQKDFVRWFHEQYEQSADSDQFHEKWLSSLFFDGMNQPAGEPVGVELPAAVEETISEIAYMNGGLFQPDDLDENDTFLSDATLNAVIRGFLEEYNFTVTEESPYDIDVAVDPAMLGKIYESLIAEQERGEAGIFYTPRVEVDLMCRMALYEQFPKSDFDTNLVIDFVFNEPNDWHVQHDLTQERRDQLKDWLEDIDAVDPACGSGAFLVGLKRVMTELCRKLGIEVDYRLKEKIIEENIYGVDVKDWAIRVAEFRLWLSLVESESELPEQRPVLPNFRFKLRDADSIVQKLGDDRLSFEQIAKRAVGETVQELETLQELKSDYYAGAAVGNEIRETQLKIVRSHVDRLIGRAEGDPTEQTTLAGSDTVDASDCIDDELETQLSSLRETKQELASIDAEGPFLWELDFAEVMLNGGFDIVIGNPPYVRRETLYPQDIVPERIDAMEDSEVKSVKDQYVSDLRNYVEDTYDIKPGKWSDLYIYFFFRGYDLLKDDGSLVYVTSNSWLSSDYGEKLQEGLLKHSDLQYILSNERQRTFEDAEVNTVITSLRKRGGTGELQSTTSFITVKQPYSTITDAETVRYLLHGATFSDSENEQPTTTTIDTEFRREPVLVEELSDLRRVTLSHESLWSLGGGTVQNSGTDQSSNRVYSEEYEAGGAQSNLAGYRNDESAFVAGEYGGDMNWNVFIRAPDIFFEEVQSELQLKLEEIADVHLGLNSGRNSFFYLTDDEIREHDIEDEYLTPLLKSPKEIDGYSVEMDDLKYKVLNVKKDRSELAGTAIYEYIKRGEAEGYHNRPFFRSKDKSNWYKKTMYDSPLVQPRDVNTRHFAALNDNDVCVDVRLVCIDPVVDDALIWGFLNSSIGIFVKELFGRVGLGGGALENYVGDTKPMPVFNPANVSDSTIANIESILDRMRDRMIGEISKEFGASSPRTFDLDGVLEDRRALDKIVMGNVMSLSDVSQERVYEATLELVNSRIEKSESV